MWVEDKEELKKLATDFFKDLFTTDPSTGGVMRGCFPQTSEEVRRKLDTDYSLEDTSRALKGIGSLKISGPIGFQPLFYRITWN